MIGVPCAEFLGRDIDGATGELRSEIDLLRQVAATLGNVVQPLPRRLQRYVVPLLSVAFPVPVGGALSDFGRERTDSGRHLLAHGGQFDPGFGEGVRIATLRRERSRLIDELAEGLLEDREQPGGRVALSDRPGEVALDQPEKPIRLSPVEPDDRGDGLLLLRAEVPDRVETFR